LAAELTSERQRLDVLTGELAEARTEAEAAVAFASAVSREARAASSAAVEAKPRACRVRVLW
jgi:hypothetical protein